MPDPTDTQLDELRRKARRRLIGAIVLALGAAVLVPMLLESDPKPLGEDVSVKIPPVDDSKFVSKLADKGKAPVEQAADAKPAAETPKPPVEATPSAASSPKDGGTSPSRQLAQAEQRVISPGVRPAPADATPSPAAKPAPSDAAKPVEAPKSSEPQKAAESSKAAEPAKAADASKARESVAKAPESSKSGPGAYSVQLAAFTDDKGANSLAAKLKKAGHPAYTEPYDTSRGRVWRVRVGPFPSRDAAEAARAKLKAEGYSGILAAVS